MSKPRVLFLTGGNPDASFVKADLQILRKACHVVPIETGGSPMQRIVALLRACKRILFSGTDLVYVWFAGVSYAPIIALATRLAGVPLVLVSGGADVANCPDVNFGDARVWWRRLLVRFALERANMVLAFSASARKEIERFAHPARIVVEAPSIQFADTPASVPAASREPLVITVSSINAVSVQQKGLDAFVRAAANLPHARFVLIGRHADPAAVQALRQIAPPNVEFCGAVSGEELQRYFSRARVYAQLSAHEGFGLAAAEARAAGCHVVATDRGSLPEVLGDTAAYVPFGDVAATARAIDAALSDTRPLSDVSADFQRRYGRAARESALLAHVRELLSDRPRGPVRLNLGCGSLLSPGYVNVDARRTIATDAVADVRFLPFRSGTADHVQALCLLEHLTDPYMVMDEIHRILKPGGTAALRVPNIGTYSAHLDTTHEFLADLAIWKEVMDGYFRTVRIDPVGLKYRYNTLLVFVNWVLVRVLRQTELAQGWTFVCSQRRDTPERRYKGWWMEGPAETHTVTPAVAARPAEIVPDSTVELHRVRSH
ncbi:MAG: glycosyltransferase [Vicinamibacterales bacterium]